MAGKETSTHQDPTPPPQTHAKRQMQPTKTFGTSLNEADHHSILFNQPEKQVPDGGLLPSGSANTIGRCLGFLPSMLDVIEANPLLFVGTPVYG